MLGWLILLLLASPSIHAAAWSDPALIACLGGIGPEGPGANNLFQVARSDQSHSGAVVSGTTPGVSYAYADGGSGGNASYARLTQVTYPTTTTKPSYLYPAAGTIGDRLSRLDSIASDSTGTTKYMQYSAWLGAGTNITVDHPAVTGGLSFIQVGTAIDMVDNFMEPTDWKWRNASGSTVFDRYLYAYDRVGNRTSRQNAVIAARDEFATFDGLNRLAKFNRGTLSSGAIADTAATFNQSWTLDSLGNWTGFGVDANGGANSFVSQTRVHNKVNEIDADNIDSNAPGIAISGTGANWVDPAYDSAGSMRSGPKPGSELTIRQHYRWDAWNRLTAVLADNAGNPGSIVAIYTYDGLGRRIRKVVGAVILDSFYSEEWQEIEVRKNSAPTAYTQFIYDPRYIDAPAVRFRDTDGNGSLDETMYYGQDFQFNTTSLVTSTGSIAERYIYDPYGKVAIFDPTWTATRSVSSFDNQILFTGRILDSESGIYQFRNRYYDPSLGRFTSRDASGYVDGASLYAAYYVPNGIDPSGNHWELINGKWVWVPEPGESPNFKPLFTATGYPIPVTGSGQPPAEGSDYDPAAGQAASIAAQNAYNQQAAQWQADHPGQIPSKDAGSRFKTPKYTNADVKAMMGQLNQIFAAMIPIGEGGGIAAETSASLWNTLAKTIMGDCAAAKAGANGAKNLTDVARWGRPGLEPGDWVMKGKDTWLNYLRSFKWQPGMGNQFAPKGAGEVFQVPREAVQWPSGWGIDGWWKGLFGQRRYIPPAGGGG